MSQASKPTGFFGRLLARGMAWGHRGFYKNTARILNLKNDDKYLEIGFGSGLFVKKYASHVSHIAGLDYSEDMVKLASSINRDLIESGKANSYKAMFPIYLGRITSFPLLWELRHFSSGPSQKHHLKKYSEYWHLKAG
jgi:hypothetical protein